MSNIIKNHNWSNPAINYIKDAYIEEWDMKAAGLSALKELKYLPLNKVEELEKMNKTDRNIAIGVMQRNDQNMIKSILNKIADIREQFFVKNNIKEQNIISIKKDAITLYDSKISEVHFGQNFDFCLKLKATSYVKLGNKEFYLNGISGEFVVKGLGDTYEKKSIIELIRKVILKCETLGKEERFKYLQDIQKQYLSFQFPIEYYKDPVTNEYLIEGFGLSTPDPSAFSSKDIYIGDVYETYLRPLVQAVI